MQTTSAHARRERRRATRRREKISKNILLLGGGLLILGVILALTLPGNPQVNGPARIGQAIPDFSLIDLDGNPVRVSDYTGRPLLINAWATWCPPCRAEMPDLHAFYQAHQEEGFAILAVNAGETQTPVQDFISQMGFTFPVLLDPGQNVLSQLGINSYPTSILVNQNGIVEDIHIGMLTAEMLESKISPLLVP